MYSFLKISTWKGTLQPWWIHHGHGESTTTLIESDVEALCHYGLIMPLLIDHDPHELITTVVILPRPLLDLDDVLEGYYNFIVPVLLTMAMIKCIYRVFKFS